MVTVKETIKGNYVLVEVDNCPYSLIVWNREYYNSSNDGFLIDLSDDRGDYNINMNYSDIDAMIAMLHAAKKILISQEL